MNNIMRTIVWAIVVLFVVCIASVVLLRLFAEGEATTTITAILATLPATVAVVAALVRVEQMGTTVNKVEHDTHRLVNGLMDSKIRAGVADVLPDDLVDPAARDQLENDRSRIDRETEHGGNGNGTPTP